ncbi:MAG: ABC transporter permease [Actinomycetota bacterium]|jgi:NitT/TauT family transport system permease protein|nr:ABC transporter permease [Actinomycetota bacterium]MDA3014081.1 ABC transporter permease [Actinomycetota bacterium]MDA3028063.1 ABC transporter permease [Actinomycetota bacterium]
MTTIENQTTATEPRDDDAPRPIDRPSLAHRLTGSIVPPLVLGAFVLLGWYGVSYLLLDPKRRFLLKPPHEVLQQGFLEWSTFSEMLSGLWSSTKVAMIGLVIAIAIGFVLATIMSQARTIERAVFPYMVTLQAIPILAIVPLISFWWGTGQRSRVIVCVIIALFPIIVNTLFGLQSAERGMHDLFTLHHASRVTRLRKLMFPAALPAIFAGLRISAGLSVIGAIVGDFFFGRGDVGIGQLLRRYSSQLMGEELLAAVIMSSALGVTVFLTFGWIQNVAIGKWHETSGGRL